MFTLCGCTKVNKVASNTESSNADIETTELNEVILQPPMQGSILHEIDGFIYRYPITNRISYHEDGTIYGSSGASYSYLFKIKFNETEFWEEFIAIQEQYPNIIIDSYEFNHNNIVTLLAD